MPGEKNPFADSDDPHSHGDEPLGYEEAPIDFTTFCSLIDLTMHSINPNDPQLARAQDAARSLLTSDEIKMTERVSERYRKLREQEDI